MNNQVLPLNESNLIEQIAIVPRKDLEVAMRWLDALFQVGAIDALSVEFARLIEKLQVQSIDFKQKQALICLAGLTVYELNQGHVCLDLDAKPWHKILPLHFYHQSSQVLSEVSHELMETLADLNWHALLSTHHLVIFKPEFSPTTPLKLKGYPFVYDGKNIYLMRYWFYEAKIAQHLFHLAKPKAFDSKQLKSYRTLLDHLFYRQYESFFSSLKLKSNAKECQVFLTDVLDIVLADKIDWETVWQLVQNAKSASNLKALDELIPLSVCLNWQKVAAALALTRQLAIISGGPGTGKTTTVARLLAALMMDNSANVKPAQKTPRIQLAAPTGKAAARLTQSIGEAVDKLAVCDEIKSQIPRYASTIHRLLGAKMNTVALTHHAHNPLHLDVLVLDEASMIDLSMMYQLLEALPPHAKLILLGDKDQLASVEAGAVFANICQLAPPGFSKGYRQDLIDVTGFEALITRRIQKENQIADSLCFLQKSYRFHQGSGIGQLAKAINLGSSKALQQVLDKGFNDISIHAYPLIQAQNPSLQDEQLETLALFEDLVYKGYQNYCMKISQTIGVAQRQDDIPSEDTSEDLLLEKQICDSSSQDKFIQEKLMQEKARVILKAFLDFKILAALRAGDFGVLGLNQRIENILIKKRLLSHFFGETWYVGRPIMVTQNDSQLGLHNGDIGICLLDTSSPRSPRMRVYFEMPDQQIKGVLPSQMPEHETAFAMTIHKSQGSEFKHTLVVLPDKWMPILTRELVYTGVTRAKEKLDIFTSTDVLKQSISVQTQRSSGLTHKLCS